MPTRSRCTSSECGTRSARSASRTTWAGSTCWTRYRFHDVRLNPRIRHARHAVAPDERRSPFSPALWDPAPDQDVKQMWFPASHLDVGGGHREKGLSDGALQRMIEQARDTAGLAFHKTTLDQIRPDPLDVGCAAR
ncbi:MAG: phospholipase effector Tle1 domain-containing protein [Pseudonocardiaceae bacterium]